MPFFVDCVKQLSQPVESLYRSHMAYDYEALYATTPNALGTPNVVFVAFFKEYRRARARVLDIGCGQGRDALFIARRGHLVTGIDLSPSGIESLRVAASREGLSVTGIVADITGYTPDPSMTFC